MSPRAKYNNRTDSQAGRSFSQVLFKRRSNKPLIVYLPVEVDGTQTATYVFLNTYWEMLGQIYHGKRRTHPTDYKLNHVNLGKENPIKKAKLTLSVSDERFHF